MNLVRDRRRRSVVALAVVAAVLLLAGCTTISGLIDTENALERAGYTDVDVGASSDNGFDRIEVVVRPTSTETSDADEAEGAAEVVWTTFPLRFDLVRVELLRPDEYTTTFTYSEMREIFGARSPDLDDKELGDEFVKAGLGIAIVLVVGGVFAIGAVVLAIVFGVRASRKRKSVTPPPWPPVIS